VRIVTFLPMKIVAGVGNKRRQAMASAVENRFCSLQKYLHLNFCFLNPLPRGFLSGVLMFPNKTHLAFHTFLPFFHFLSIVSSNMRTALGS
jgi:hypothetical protein